MPPVDLSHHSMGAQLFPYRAFFATSVWSLEWPSFLSWRPIWDPVPASQPGLPLPLQGAAHDYRGLSACSSCPQGGQDLPPAILRPLRSLGRTRLNKEHISNIWDYWFSSLQLHNCSGSLETNFASLSFSLETCQTQQMGTNSHVNGTSTPWKWCWG